MRREQHSIVVDLTRSWRALKRLARAIRLAFAERAEIARKKRARRDGGAS